MSRLRRHRAGVVALALALLATLLVLFALDVRTWHGTVARDDLRFRAMPSHARLWRPGTLLPADPAGRALATSDAVAYRHAIQLFWFSRVGANPEAQQDLPTTRAEAQQQLAGLASSGATVTERSTAANLLGVLAVTTPVAPGDRAAAIAMIRTAIGDFQRAIRIDPTNTDAKQNLELVLRVTRPGKGQLGHSARGGYGFGKGQAAQPVGSGY